MQELEIAERISDVSTASCIIPVLTPDGKKREGITADVFREMNRVMVTRSTATEEFVLFRGYIHAVEASPDYIKIILQDMLGLLEYRILKNSVHFAGTTVANLVAAASTHT